MTVAVHSIHDTAVSSRGSETLLINTGIISGSSIFASRESRVTAQSASETSMHINGGSILTVGTLNNSQAHLQGKAFVTMTVMHGSQLTTGKYDDTVIANAVSASNINTGGGNDSFVAVHFGGSLDTGAGNYRIAVQMVSDGQITTGAGNDTLYFSFTPGTERADISDSDEAYFAHCP